MKAELAATEALM
jgi:hypothetical protein